MGNETLNTVKGHGFAVGDQVNFYGMGNSEFGPTNEPTLCVLTKMGNKYVLTHTATVKGDTITWEFGPAAKIWANKVETVAVSPVALGQTVHNVETDEVFTVAEVTPRSVSLRKIGTWRDGVTVPMVDIADMIHMGTLVIIGNPGDKRAEVETTTNDEGHGFSGHSRRPMECRLCGKLAEFHATTTDEGSSRQMWIKARTPLVTDQIKAWGARTANVLKAIAELGGSVTAWDLGSGRGWHKTAVRIVMESGALVETDPSEELGKTYILSDMGRQACEWHGFTIAEPVKVAEDVFAMYDPNVARVVARLRYFTRVLTNGAALHMDVLPEHVEAARKAGLIAEHGDWLAVTELGSELLTQGDKAEAFFHFNPDKIPANPEPFSDRDMRDQIIAYLGSDVDAFYVDGIVDHLIKTHNGAINIDDVDAGSWHGTVALFHKLSEVASIGEQAEIASLPDCCNECEWDASERQVWSGTDTLIKPSIRTGLARRKRKATKKARRAVKGGF